MRGWEEGGGEGFLGGSGVSWRLDCWMNGWLVSE